MSSESDVIIAAIRWYRDVLRTRDELSKTESELFYAVSSLENEKSETVQSAGLYSRERSTTPAPSILMEELLTKSKKDVNE